jgi:hypothetical protein
MSSTSRSEIVLVALLFVLLAQVARTMFPQVIVLGEDWDYLYAGLISIAVFAAPILAWPLTSLRERHLLVAGTVAMIAARVALQLLHPISTWLSMTATAAALLGATLAILALPRGRRGPVVALGVALGLALDTALRAPFRSWDLAWQDGPAAAVLTTGLVATSAIALTVTLRLASRAPGDRVRRDSSRSDRSSRSNCSSCRTSATSARRPGSGSPARRLWSSEGTRSGCGCSRSGGTRRRRGRWSWSARSSRPRWPRSSRSSTASLRSAW